MDEEEGEGRERGKERNEDRDAYTSVVSQGIEVNSRKWVFKQATDQVVPHVHLFDNVINHNLLERGSEGERGGKGKERDTWKNTSIVAVPHKPQI